MYINEAILMAMSEEEITEDLKVYITRHFSHWYMKVPMEGECELYQENGIKRGELTRDDLLAADWEIYEKAR